MMLGEGVTIGDRKEQIFLILGILSPKGMGQLIGGFWRLANWSNLIPPQALAPVGPSS